MSKKFNKNRSIFLINVLVTLISVIALLLAVFSHLNYSSVQKDLLSGFHDCMEEQKSFGSDIVEQAQTCAFYMQEITAYKNQMINSYQVGIGLPLIFFGIKALYNYIFEEEESEILIE